MWFEDAVFYHMYPIGMAGVHRVNDVTEVEHHFDDLKKWLPHIKSMKANAIYIGPLFESNAHGYDTRDYKLVDRRLGDNEDFKEFVEEAHKLGIKVVVDGVFNHTGRDFWAFNDIKEKRENSPYCSWYRGLNFGGNTAYNDGFYYDAWHNCFDLANLNLENEEVRRYLIEDVINFWIDAFDIDGIRLDCADCLPGYFQEEMRRFVDTKKPEFWLMGEVIHGDYNVYVQPDRLDSVTNYELHKALYSGHNDHNYFEIAHSCRREFEENGGMYRDKYLYSFVDNHDVDRLASKLQNKEHLYPIYSLLYTLPGIPSVYYGSEWGIEGRKEGASDDGMRPEVHIEEVLKDNPNPELMEFIAELGTMREKYSPLRHGIYRELLLTNRQYAFARIEEDACVITAVNNDENNAEIQIPVPFQDKAYYNVSTQEDCPVESGRILLRLAASGSVFIASK